ncbi:TIGR03943: family protein [Actinomadura rubteroloni]|uniref:TIGR03943: family protein n=1 Tax=Actinomadura rubteroloni TaxID=1926885 RepID=A0A2P4UD71_9ACTN|nr:TIGR03943 family protein [Actinomadura rubteroloni]POM22987.1 TIGR03943: family protein [Actinomadura rubteroloni]
MSRPAQNLLLVALGAAALWITLATGEYLSYVRPGFRLPLAAAGAVLVVLGGAGLVRDRHAASAHHHHGPGVAWLLAVPVVAVAVVAPPALGSFTATRTASRPAPPPRPPDEGYAALPVTAEPDDMSLGEYIGRAFQARDGRPEVLGDATVRLTGFASPRKGGGWFLTRMVIACCAGDAVPFRVVVHGAPSPGADRWVRVTGTWHRPPAGLRATTEPALDARRVIRVPRPAHPYE